MQTPALQIGLLHASWHSHLLQPHPIPSHCILLYRIPLHHIPPHSQRALLAFSSGAAPVPACQACSRATPTTVDQIKHLLTISDLF